MHIRFYLDFCPGLLAALTIQRIVVLPTAFRTVIVVCAPVAVLEPDIGHIIRNAEARDYVLVCIVGLHLSGIMLRMLYFQMLIQRTFRPTNKQKQFNSCQSNINHPRQMAKKHVRAAWNQRIRMDGIEWKLLTHMTLGSPREGTRSGGLSHWLSCGGASSSRLWCRKSSPELLRGLIC